MMTVSQYADPTPVSSTPISHAWGVKSGSRPTVRSNTQAARTDTVNCKAFTPVTYQMEAARG
jgi:hypothetical protein